MAIQHDHEPNNRKLHEWLAGLGVQQYFDAFTSNAIDWHLVPNLSDQDLKDIGISALGHRKKLLDAIKSLSDAAKRSQSTTMQAGPTAVDRRQLTVMFVDLVGSTPLSETLDPEELQDVIRAYQNTCSKFVTQLEGYVSRYVGDGVLAYFGYPQAHEDDAARAAEAGLKIVGSLSDLSATFRPIYDVELMVRIGIATGLVVVGDLVSDGSIYQGSAIGRTPNLAARLQSIANTNAILIDPTTHSLLGGSFKYEELGNRELKGIAEPVFVRRILRTTQVESRFDAKHTETLATMIDRDDEMALLAERWQQAKMGNGQVVLLSGEPGIGKSRIARALRDKVFDECYSHLSYQCSPFHQNSALYPIIAQMERVAGFANSDTAETKLQKLELLLGRLAEPASEFAPIFAGLLSIPTGERYPHSPLAPDKHRELVLDAVVDLLESIAAQGPVLLVFEDVHWIDPTSLELCERVIDRARSNRILMVVTFRSEFLHTWSTNSHITSLALKRLSTQQTEAMIENITVGRAFPAEFHRQVVAKTDGVPLFIEELTKMLLESDHLTRQSRGHAPHRFSPASVIPDTLRDSLRARLDLHAEFRAIYEIGATIGREFSYPLLAAVGEWDDGELRTGLQQLTNSGLILRRTTLKNERYIFKHALIQETAYESILNRIKRQYHSLIAAALTTKFATVVESEPEVVAHHFSKATRQAEALSYWLLAGERAIKRSHYEEAAGHLKNGLADLKAVSNPDDHRQTELGLLASLGVALIATNGYGSPEVGQTYTRARHLCAEIDEPLRLIPILQGLYRYYLIRAEMDTALGVAERMLSLAKGSDGDSQLFEAHRAVGNSFAAKGEFSSALSHFETCYAGLTAQPTEIKPPSIQLLDTLTACQSVEALVLWNLGYPNQALEKTRQSLVRARELMHPFNLACALSYASIVHHFFGHIEEMKKISEECIALSKEHQFPFWLAGARIVRGWVAVSIGDAEEGMEQMTKGFEMYESIGAEVFMPYYTSLLADAYSKIGKHEMGVAALNDAMDATAKSGEHWWDADLCRQKGKLLSADSMHSLKDAENCVRQAISVARRQQAKSLELRATATLCSLEIMAGKPRNAHSALSRLLDSFQEGLDTQDLKEAQHLLDEWSAGD